MMTNNVADKLKYILGEGSNRKVFFLLGILLLLLVIQTLSPIEPISRLLLYDETNHLRNGYENTFDFSMHEGSPAYDAFYYLISFSGLSTIDAYYFNHIFLVSLTVLLLFYTGYSFSERYIIGLLAAFIVLFDANHIWPRVNYLTLSCLLIYSISLNLFFKNYLAKTVYSLCVAYLIIFVRPEFILTFYIFYIVAIFFLLKSIYSGEALKEKRVFLLCFLLIAFSLLGLPSSSGEDRSLLAFGQHYALGIYKREGLTGNPWLNWEEILIRDFGGLSSLSSFLVTNPVAVFEHCFYNLIKSADKILPIWLLISYLIFRQKLSLTELCDRYSTSLFISIFILPVLVSILVIYPREHYILVFNGLSFVILSEVIKFRKFTKEIDRLIAVILLIVFLTFSLPLKEKSKDINLDVLNDIQLLKMSEYKLDPMLEVDGGWCVYLAQCTSRVTVIETELKKNICAYNSFMVSSGLKDIENISLQKLILSPHDFGFDKFELIHGYELLIKSVSEGRNNCEENMR